MATHSPDSQEQKKLNEKLIHAVERGHISDATTALAEGASPNYAYTKKGIHLFHHWDDDDTPLHMAIKNRSTTLVKLLIIFDAKTNLKNGKGKTPL